MKDLEKSIYKYLEERNWHHPRPGDLSKSIMIEGAELLELFQWENLSLEEIKDNPDKIEKIKKELADVLIYAFELSVLLGFDTEDIVRSKLEKISKKYPAELMKERQENGGDASDYWRIKKEYRKNGLD